MLPSSRLRAPPFWPRMRRCCSGLGPGGLDAASPAGRRGSWFSKPRSGNVGSLDLWYAVARDGVRSEAAALARRRRRLPPLREGRTRGAGGTGWSRPKRSWRAGRIQKLPHGLGSRSIQGRDRPRHRGGPCLRAAILEAVGSRHPTHHIVTKEPTSRARDRATSVHRPPRRAGELRALVPVLLRFGGAGDRRRDRRGGRLRTGAGRALLGGEGVGRAPERPAARGHDASRLIEACSSPAPGTTSTRSSTSGCAPSTGSRARRAPCAATVGGARPVLRRGGARGRLLGGHPEAVGHGRRRPRRRGGGGEGDVARRHAARPRADGCVATNGLLHDAPSRPARGDARARVTGPARPPHRSGNPRDNRSPLQRPGGVTGSHATLKRS